MSVIIKKTIFFIVLILSFFVLSSHVNAASLIPESLDVLALPGDTTIIKFDILNNSQEKKEYFIDLLSVEIDKISGDISFYATDYLQNWISFSENAISVEGMSNGEISASVSIPKEIDHGIYTFAVRVVEITDPDNFISVNTGFISLIFVQIGEDLSKQASVLDFDTQPRISSQLPIDFFVTMRNEGQSICRPSGIITIKNILGGIVDIIPINETGNRIVPNQTRTLSSEWGFNQRSDGFFQNLKNEIGQFTFGIFQIEPVIVLFDNDAVEIDKIWIIVFPWRLVSLISAILLFALGLLYWLRQRV